MSPALQQILDFLVKLRASGLSHEAVIEIMIALLGVMLAVLALLLVVASIVIAIIGVIGYQNIKDAAQSAAKIEARSVATKIAKRTLAQERSRSQAAGLSAGQAEEIPQKKTRTGSPRPKRAPVRATNDKGLGKPKETK